MTETTLKTCRRCSEEKPVTEFGKDKRNRDGRRAYCNDCRRKRARQRRHDARGVTQTTVDTNPVTPRGPVPPCAATNTDAGEDRGVDRAAGAWPQPLDPEKDQAALVERRERVIRIYRELDARLARGSNTGKRGREGWQRRIFGDGKGGEA